MINVAVSFLKGIVVGIANVIPGVSGGTIMVVLGVFDGIIAAINNFYKSFEQFKKYFIFLFPIALGCLTGILAFSRLIETALTNFSFPTVMFFGGLVMGSLPLIYKKATEKRFDRRYFIATAIAAIFVIGISLLSSGGSAETEAVTTSGIIKFFFGGALASAAMIMPGISGSFIMLLLGLYYDVLHALSSLSSFLSNPGDFSILSEPLKILIPLALGILIGIVLISKIISILLDKYYGITYCAILGLLLGSVFGMFNDPIAYQSGINAVAVISGLATGSLGFVMALYFSEK